MLRHWIIAVLLCPLLLACSAAKNQKEAATQTAAQPSPQTFALGAQLAPAGFVPNEAASETFSRGGEVFLSVDVTGASTDQNVEVQWLDSSGQVMRHEARHVPEGAHYVAFSSGRVSMKGDYKAVVVIDGRRVTELPFAVM